MDYKKEVTENDSNRQAANKILNAHCAGEVVILVGKCTVDYSGRAWTYLDESKRTIIINPTGAVIVHGPKSVKPKNWQPEDAETAVRMDEKNKLVIRSERSNPDESLVIRFSQVSDSIHYEPSEDSVEVEGTENQIHKYIIKNPEIISEDFTVTEHEKETDVGDIDIFGYDGNDYPIIVEVKRRKGQLKHVDQLSRYIDEIGKSSSIGVLVAPDITDSAKKQLDKKGFNYVPLSPEEVVN